MYSAAVSSQLRGDPPATGNLSPIKFAARREGIVVSSIDSIDISESSMQEEGYGSYCEDDHFTCIARNAPNNARYVFAQHEAGHFLVGYLLGVLTKGLQGTNHRSSDAGEVHCSCHSKMLKKDTGQLDDRSLNNFSCVILGGLVAEHKISTRRVIFVEAEERCEKSNEDGVVRYDLGIEDGEAGTVMSMHDQSLKRIR
ncbi:hypothetical protein Ddye_028426 [Dipteronia dyeriana]|uniref:Peptidase M41 domain-containing protein n=1 Tax=Dipteronia dyeriana TaxID=168575 RepID=A0AAD9TR58_9ROSI|nr:hypothetical protein Ddye_028426 [Dipteronia dyeriana]